jgi:hypothetical protein
VDAAFAKPSLDGSVDRLCKRVILVRGGAVCVVQSSFVQFLQGDLPIAVEPLTDYHTSQTDLLGDGALVFEAPQTYTLREHCRMSQHRD